MGIKEKKERKKIWQYKNQGMEVIKGRGKGSHEGKAPNIGKKETKEGRKEEKQKEEGSRKGWIMVTVSKRDNRKEEKDKKATSKERNRKEESTCSEHQGNKKEVERKRTR